MDVPYYALDDSPAFEPPQLGLVDDQESMGTIM